MEFVLEQPVAIEESLTCEFKEVKAQPLQAIGKVVDRHIVAFLNAEGGSIYWGIRDKDRVVTGLKAPHKLRDDLRQVIGQKIAAIAPGIPPAVVAAPFHDVLDSNGQAIRDIHVLEVKVGKPMGCNLFLTGSGEAFRRTLGGVKKLSGSELFIALTTPLQVKVNNSEEASFLSQFPAVYRRAKLVSSLVRDRRVLWVDDNPSSTFYERVALAEMGIKVDVATSSEEGLMAATSLNPDVILSDIARHGKQNAGLEFLQTARAMGIECPMVFYVGQLDQRRGVPGGAFGITNRPDEVLHLVLDVLERA
jgi:CheY-like chemotaxis protein